MDKYVIGLDYGSDSARAVLVNAATGETLATAVRYYPRWKEGKYCNPAINQYRQHPKDYIEVLEATVREVLGAVSSEVAENVVGIAFDTTGSTPCFIDEEGTPLALKEGFEENPTQALQYNFKHPRYHLLPTLKGLEIQRYTRTEKIYRLPDTRPAVHLHVLLFRPPQKTLCIKSLNQLSFSNMH